MFNFLAHRVILTRSAGSLLSALAFAVAPAYAGENGTNLVSAETLTVAADVRVIGVDGEMPWIKDGFGKLRYGNDAMETGFKIKPHFAEADIVWQPRFSWSLSGLVVGTVQQKGKLEADLSEAVLSFKPLSAGSTKFSARAGLMWPPISLEHSGPEWAVTDTITPSAINSWVGEEVKVVGAEISASTQFGGHKVAATVGLFDMNDTAGAQLAFRGWAQHDMKATAFRKQPLPVFNDFIQFVQPRYSHPVLELDGGYLKRPGFYAKLAWDPPLPIHLEALHYDNGSNPESYNVDNEWGWRTKFDNVGAIVDLSPTTQLKAQAMMGRTLMGYPEPDIIWVDTKFRSAFALVTHKFDKASVSGRIEAFSTRNLGSTLTSEDDENGWSATIAAKRSLGQYATALLEVLHVNSDRAARRREMINPSQSQTQAQFSLRMKW
jgi:hypothetical protein